MFTFMINTDTELKLLEERHAEKVFSLIDQSRDSLRNWLPWVDATKTIHDSKDFINAGLRQFSNNNGFQAGIWYQGELAGVIGLHHIDWSNRATSIGYWLGRKFEGKGLMTKACRAVVDYCFTELKLHRIEIRAATENHKSLAIPERLGFQKEGCLRSSEWLSDKYVDHYVFSLIQHDD